jgi:diguanylate cyclase (GGDEF)-like protein/PAS domain S-box-containing protein
MGSGPVLANDGSSSADWLQLRQLAELRLVNQSPLVCTEQVARLQPAMPDLIHELRVHQVELEVQNEELRRAQAELDVSQARYFDFYDLAPVGYCLVSGNNLIKQVNLTTAKMLGVYRDHILGQLFSSFVVPEDQDVFYLFRTRVLSTPEPADCELRLTKTDKTIFWAHLVALAVLDDDGAPALRLVLSDISERKEIEEKLLLAASVFSHAGEGIVITDAKGNVKEVNAAFTRITGYSRAEVMGNNMRILQSDRQDSVFYAKMWNELLSAGTWLGEIWNRRKDGEIYPELLRINAVPDPHGGVQSYVAMFSDISSAKAHVRQMEYLAHYDALTGLPNRRLNADRLKQAMANARRSGQRLAVVYIDLDGFKTINDQFGHDAGDQVLIATARHMQQVLREGDTLARLGGDEFVAVLINLNNLETWAPLLDRLALSVTEATAHGKQMLQVTASLGVAWYPQAQEVEADQLLRQADQAMYQAKISGKNRYVVFDTA